ncbi:hypothetical protein RvY_03580-3 [Ramazzottius varieornatus]|uniref:Uncharacterized protein n=1 Tax=Ramazzottius varieornatus TaxID=947166 RepID=A0A1D1UU96_RAMVA|nr:hypothetical protein RvY_03580-3 [Ramazzottius varieornatus]
MPPLPPSETSRQFFRGQEATKANVTAFKAALNDTFRAAASAAIDAAKDLQGSLSSVPFSDIAKDYGTSLNAMVVDFINLALIPGLRNDLGLCRPVYDAFTAITIAFCTSTTPPLMGVWFGAGLCVFSFAFLVPFIYYLSRFYTQGRTAKDGRGQPSMFSIARSSILSGFSRSSRRSSGRNSRRSSSLSSRKSRNSGAGSRTSKSVARPSAAIALGARGSVPPAISRPSAPLPPGARPSTPSAAIPRPGSATVPPVTPPRSSAPTVAARPSVPSRASGPVRSITLGARRTASRPSAAALATAAGASRPSIMARPRAR